MSIRCIRFSHIVTGWESRVKEQIDEMREEELRWIFRRKMLGLVNMSVNYVRPFTSSDGGDVG
jgi:hypothetical protein